MGKCTYFPKLPPPCNSTCLKAIRRSEVIQRFPDIIIIEASFCSSKVIRNIIHGKYVRYPFLQKKREGRLQKYYAQLLVFFLNHGALGER